MSKVDLRSEMFLKNARRAVCGTVFVDLNKFKMMNDK